MQRLVEDATFISTVGF